MKLISDSGSTKTDWSVTDGGCIIHSASTQGINPFHQDEATIAAIIRDELMPQLSAYGDSVAPTPGTPGKIEISAIHFYGSGCREECVPMMTRVFRDAFPEAEVIEAVGDLLGAARAVCGVEEGIACILGTGANSCLYDGRNIVKNTPPLGYILGDEGSGAVLGRLFVNALFKNGLPQSVCDAFEAETSLTLADVIHRVYREPLANRFLSALAPLIHRHRTVPAVHDLIIDNFRAFFRRNVVQYARPDLPVSAVGSIAHYFCDEFAAAARAEGFTIGTVLKSPMEGLVAFHACRRIV